MNENAGKLLPMTVDEFLTFEGEPDTRYELVGGTPMAMSPAASFHRIIAGNAWGELNARLEARPPCRAEPEAGIWINDVDYFVADIATTCVPPSNTVPVVDPV